MADFEPYRGGGMDPLQMFMQLQQLKASREQQEQRRQLLEQQKRSQGIDFMMELAGKTDPAQFNQMVPFVAQEHNLDASVVDFGRGLNKTAAAQRKAQQTGNILGTPAAAQALSALGPASPADAQTAALEQLRQFAEQSGADPDAVVSFAELSRQGQAAEQKLRQQNIAEQEAASRRASAAAAAQQEAIAIRADQRRSGMAEQDQLVEDMATTIASTQLGYLDPQAITSATSNFAKRVQDPNKRVELMQKIHSRSVAIQAGLTERGASASTGRSDSERITASVASKFGISQDDARLYVNKMAIIDPVLSEPGNAVVIPTTPGASAKIEEARIALRDSLDRLPDMRASFSRAREAAQRAGAGPIGGPVVGMQGPQQFLRALGAQEPAAADYENRSREFVSLLLKARQGSRPSDFDMKFYLAMVPSLTELFGRAGEARFTALEDSLNIAARSVVNPALGTEIRRKKAPSTTADKSMESAAIRFSTGEIGLEEFNSALEKWKRSGGNRYRTVDLNAAPAGVADSVADEMFGR